jgi:hypothetical protein
MHGAWLGAFAAPHVAGYHPHDATAAVPGTAVILHLNAVVQRGIKQQFASSSGKTFPVDCNLGH